MLRDRVGRAGFGNLMGSAGGLENLVLHGDGSAGCHILLLYRKRT